MKLIMTLLVRDEEDILKTNIEYHLSRGVDFIIATDNLSVDRTPAILKHYQQKGLLHIINEHDDDYSQAKWVTRMARLAHNDYNADWVIHSDADEFWWPDHSKSLKDVLSEIPAEYNAVSVERHNLLPCQNETNNSFFKTMIFRDTNSLNSLGDPLPPKIIHRSDSEIRIEQGNHSALIPEKEMNSLKSSNLYIYHLPLRTFKQFSNKIIRGGAAYERNADLDKTIGLTWRYLYDLHKSGMLEEHYLKQTLQEDSIQDMIDAGKIIKDTALMEYLEKHSILS